MSDLVEAQLSELSTEVFQKFLSALEQAGLSDDLCARLHQTLLVDQRFSDVALRNAVFGEQAPQ